MSEAYEKLVLKQYQTWTELSDIKEESAIDNGALNEYMEAISGIVGEKLFREIEDSITDAACTAQYSGFEIGFRYGIELM